MGTYIVRRLLQAILILFCLSVIFFFILHITPGGPCAAFEGAASARGAAQAHACVIRLGLNEPLYVQYIKQMSPYLHLDFGISNTGQSVSSEVLGALPATLVLIGTSYILQQLIALPMGMYAAIRKYSLFDQIFTVLAYGGFAMPTFWLGIMLIYFFGVNLGWLPAGKIESTSLPVFWTHPWFVLLSHNPGLVIGDLARHLILPMTTLLVVGVATDSRFMRASLLDVLHQDYIRTARAKGLKGYVVILKHAVRNALLPIVTNIALFLPALVGGAIVTETIFSWNGLGFMFITHLTENDYPTIQALLMISALAVLIANLLADITYALVDPRIRYD